MSALARLFLSMGKKVRGSDLKESEITQDLKVIGAVINIGHKKENLDQKIDLVVYSQDITDSSPGFVELQAADELGLMKFSYAKVLGLLMEDKYGIAVAGTNGKSTTAAILSLILVSAGLDPTAVLGTKLSAKNETEEFKANARLGVSKYVVAEVDEYYRKMLETHPKIIIVTNIAEDHLDYYKDLHDIKQAFLEYAKSLPKDGSLIYNADDHNTVETLRQAHEHKFTFGIHHYADLQAMNIRVEREKQIFDVHYKDQFFGTFELSIPGKFNISNALAAILVAIKLGIDQNVIAHVLKNFVGTRRRFEKLGMHNQTLIVSDYGHHPAAIKETLAGAKEFYPDKKILLVFQPHHRNRTQKLFGEFVEELSMADNLIVCEIFDVAGREHGEQISAKDLVDELVKRAAAAEFAKDLNETEKMVLKQIDNFDLVIFMGAGDIDLLARRLVGKA